MGVFETLDRANVSYCVLHGYEAFPQRVKSDVDCVIDPRVTPGQIFALLHRNRASLGAEEVGMLGYYSNRRIVDFVGLLQPEVAPHRARGDNLWVVRTYHPTYILAFPAWLAAVGSDPWVKEHYSTLRTFDWPGSDQATLLKSR